MKRKIISFLLVMLFCLSLTVSVFAKDADEQFLFDEADILTRSEEAELAEKLEDISHTYEAQIVIVTMDSLSGVDIDDYVEYLYDSVGFGYGEDHDGILLLVCMAEREYRILSNGAANDAIADGEIGKICDAIEGHLSDGDYAKAFGVFLDKCEYYLDGHVNGYPFNFGKTLLICLVIGLVVGVIVALVLASQLKSVRKQIRANDYVKPGSMQITIHNDMFLYRNVTRTKKQSNNGSSGGGSSRSVGGGSF